jgi:hypothetical protein
MERLGWLGDGVDRLTLKAVSWVSVGSMSKLGWCSWFDAGACGGFVLWL